jgi:hypothetical protein
MGPFGVYGTLWNVLGPLVCMGLFRVYGDLWSVWGPLVCMGLFRVYGPFRVYRALHARTQVVQAYDCKRLCRTPYYQLICGS